MSNDKNNLVYREQLDDNVIEMLSEDIGSNYSLRTENTKTIVAALNEILGKDIICNAVGNPLLTTDTFAQMGEKIHVMVNDFKAKLLGLGVSVSNVDKMASLIEKIGEIDLGVDAEELIAPLEESLREILGDEGVELSGEETLAELIIKADEEFNEKNDILNDNRYNLYQVMDDKGFNVIGNEKMDELINIFKNSDLSIDEVESLSCGFQHTLALKTDGTVWVTGLNEYGQLGTGDNNNRISFTKLNDIDDVTSIICGRYHTFILKNDGSLWGCGQNSSGQLGLNDTTDRNVFTQVTTNVNNDVSQIACGAYHTFILKNDGSLWGCGQNSSGQLGLNDDNNRTTFTQVTTNINNDVKQIACGFNHTIILKNAGSVWSCGENEYGQLGLGDTTDRKTFTQVTTNVNNDVKEVACSTDGDGLVSSYVLKCDGTLMGCGSDKVGQLGTNSTNYDSYNTLINITDNVNKIRCGGTHFVVLKNDGSVWTCGYNSTGQLGDGTNTTSRVLINVINDIIDIYAGGAQTFVITNEKKILSVGRNNYGQLGLGNTTNKNTFIEVFISNKNNLSNIITNTIDDIDTSTYNSWITKTITFPGDIGFTPNAVLLYIEYYDSEGSNYIRCHIDSTKSNSSSQYSMLGTSNPHYRIYLSSVSNTGFKIHIYPSGTSISAALYGLRGLSYLIY